MEGSVISGKGEVKGGRLVEDEGIIGGGVSSGKAGADSEPGAGEKGGGIGIEEGVSTGMGGGGNVTAVRAWGISRVSNRRRGTGDFGVMGDELGRGFPMATKFIGASVG